MMIGVIIVAEIIVAACLASAGGVKLLSGGLDPFVAQSFAVPARLASLLRWTLPTTEVLIAALVAWPPLSRVGAASAVAALGAFTALTTSAWLRGRSFACGCFGSSSSRPVDGWTVCRNVLLMGVAGVVFLHGPVDLNLLAASLVFSAAAISTLGWLLQNAVRHPAIPPATAQPAGGCSVSLVTAQGKRTTLRAILSGSSAVLVFLEPGCGPCQRIAPRVATWQHELAKRVSIVVITRDGTGLSSINPRLTSVYVQSSDDLDKAYGLRGTPSAVPLAADCNLIGPPVAGADAIERLVLTLAGTEKPQADPSQLDAHHKASLIETAQPKPPRLRINPADQGDPHPGVLAVDRRTYQSVPMADPAGRWTVLIAVRRYCADCDTVRTAAAAHPELAAYRLLLVAADHAEGNDQRDSTQVGVDRQKLRSLGLTIVPSILVLDGSGRSMTEPAIGVATVVATILALSALAGDGSNLHDAELIVT